MLVRRKAYVDNHSIAVENHSKKLSKILFLMRAIFQNEFVLLLKFIESYSTFFISNNDLIMLSMNNYSKPLKQELHVLYFDRHYLSIRR